MKRISRNAAERAKVLEEYKASGMSARAFAEQAGLPKNTFYNWLSKARHSAPPLRVAKVVRSSEAPAVRPAAASITIESGGLHIHVGRGFDPQGLHAILDVLEARTRGAQR